MFEILEHLPYAIISSKTKLFQASTSQNIDTQNASNEEIDLVRIFLVNASLFNSLPTSVFC